MATIKLQLQNSEFVFWTLHLDVLVFIEFSSTAMEIWQAFRYPFCHDHWKQLLVWFYASLMRVYSVQYNIISYSHQWMLPALLNSSLAFGKSDNQACLNLRQNMPWSKSQSVWALPYWQIAPFQLTNSAAHKTFQLRHRQAVPTWSGTPESLEAPTCRTRASDPCSISPPDWYLEYDQQGSSGSKLVYPDFEYKLPQGDSHPTWFREHFSLQLWYVKIVSISPPGDFRWSTRRHCNRFGWDFCSWIVYSRVLGISFFRCHPKRAFRMWKYHGSWMRHGLANQSGLAFHERDCVLRFCLS